MTVTNSSAIDGILLLNKPNGLTSNSALQKAKRFFGAKKAGHTGSLDPLATGMLPLCFGEATKVCQYLLDADKCYETTGLFGIKTNTSDATGDIIAHVDSFNISEIELAEVLAQYRGAIKQIPSMFSALKHQGKPLYKLAREGIVIERAARDVVISELQLKSFNGKEFSLVVNCSKGTYIRNLVEDIGDSLNVGAHVTHLHRVYTSGFENMPMYTLEQIQEMSADERKACLIPIDKAVNYMSAVVLSDADITTVRQGRVIPGSLSYTTVDCIRLYDNQSQFIGLGERQINGDIKAKRLLSFVA